VLHFNIEKRVQDTDIMADTVFVRTRGQVKELTLHSMALCKPMRLNVYLPPHYGDFSMQYPVVYLLHPWGADERYWTEDLRLHETADHLIHAGALPPFIAAPLYRRDAAGR
jgi:enterochelin esterase-like enzyme